MAKVWHVKNPTFNEKLQNFPADYELVAEVDSDRLEDIFYLTNTVHCAWWENEGVNAVKQARSTSVGDVVEVKGKRFLCGMVGWVEI